MTKKRSIKIELTCKDFPGKQFCQWKHVHLAVQEKQELRFETPGDASAQIFRFTVPYNEGKNGEPNFLGPFVFGKTGDKFLYLVWYNKDGKEVERFRRAKIKLRDISWEMLENATTNKHPIQAEIRLRDKKGGPVCASLKSENIIWK